MPGFSRLSPPNGSQPARRAARARVALAASLTGGAVLLGAPLAALSWRSLDTPTGFGLVVLPVARGGDTRLARRTLARVVNSLVYAAAATAVALVIGGLAAAVIARRRAAGSTLW